uniref:Methyltransferase type 11 domain-containing protein n=1 Tax=viral metagenome TaxID=1070528 RepID=A0A6C0BY11_9ZZZZ
MIKGINLGSGNWSHKNWIGYDKLNNNYLNETSVLPHNDDTLSYIYSCHFFEHINDETIINLLKESYRVLKKNGIIRIVVPHFNLMLDKYKKNDNNFFRKNLGSGRPEWKKYNVEHTMETVLAHWFSNYDDGDPDNRNGYRGPPRNLSSQQIKEKALSLPIEEFSNWLISHIPSGKNITTQHINCPTITKMKNLLEKAGFKNVQETSAYKSNIYDVLNTGAFNNEKRRKHISLFIEANK